MEEKKTFYMSGYVGIASLLVILIAGIGLFMERVILMVFLLF
ncbi:hypothetical protein T481_17490 [Enterococcus faecalis PF3]|nr:hypothetical protein T481_17490 [Enterococcus faecalis PF3]